ncbi:3,4-dihydroxy-2-butanone-4-phosphate synthase RibB / GTP cyclohydrolase II RibA multi-domain protein [Edwardsiella piscicida]|uniref:Uncharacterized protein n=1 Tax=Edwardsiella anguillarum ET080813 TaxID=667120 RepID=A0A076LGJ9_9GAMM|nr:Hypothetical protein ETEE_0760 [Edwardsiella anguillarum ET080813]GAJ67444.1 3,4-dihydroxy-2-butanone-4-phosphate synthase RibB / GTP cyclohydrolase II RibA multi-domain protein [Edwardsiella piscicida]
MTPPPAATRARGAISRAYLAQRGAIDVPTGLPFFFRSTRSGKTEEHIVAIMLPGNIAGAMRKADKEYFFGMMLFQQRGVNSINRQAIKLRVISS